MPTTKKYLGSTGLSRLWSKIKSTFLFKMDETPGASYTYTEPGEPSPTAVTANFITTLSGTTVTITCTLSQAVDIHLLFRLKLSGTYRRFMTVLAGRTSVTLTDSTTNSYSSLQGITDIVLENADLLASKYTFTINKSLLVGATYEHKIELKNAIVDWHAMTISGTLTRTTTALTKPQIATRYQLTKWSAGVIEYFESSNQSIIPANSTSVGVSNVSFHPTANTRAPLSPFSPTFTSSGYSNHYITSIASTGVSYLDANIGITISSWSQTNLQPELVWYRSSGACVYSGTLPRMYVNMTGLVSGDKIRIEMYAYFGTYNSDPYTKFVYTYDHGSSTGSSVSNAIIAFHDNVDNFVGIVSNGSVSTTYIVMDAYLTNTNKNINNLHVAHWPGSNTTSVTSPSTFTRSFTVPTWSSRPKSTNTSLFGTVKLNGKLW